MISLSEMTEDKSIKARRILRSLYAKVEVLHDYLNRIITDDNVKKQLVTDEDRPRYLNLLKTSLVCTQEGVTRVPRFHSYEQLSHQREIMYQEVERLQSHAQNVLSLGFDKPSGDDNHLICSTNVEYTQPNPVCTIILSRTWRVLLSRVGDEVMHHLLGYRSIFIFTPPSCYVQLTGPLIHDLLLRENAFCPNTASSTNFKAARSLPNQPGINSKRKLTAGGPGESEDPRPTKKIRLSQSTDITSKKITPADQCISKSKVSDHPNHNNDSKTIGQTRVDGKGQRKGLKRKRTWYQTQKKKALQCLWSNRRSSRQKNGVSVNVKKPVCVILKRSILHCKNLQEGFPQKNLLNTLRADTKNVDALLDDIFYKSPVTPSYWPKPDSFTNPPPSTDVQSKLSPSQLRQHAPKLQSVLLQLAKKHHRCSPRAILDGFEKNEKQKKESNEKDAGAPKLNGPVFTRPAKRAGIDVPKVEKPTVTVKSQSDKELSTSQLLSRNLDPRQVYLWMRSVLRTVFPSQMLGDKNQSKFLKLLSKFLHSGKFEAVSVNNLMANMQMKRIQWLNDFKEYSDKRAALTCLVYWLFSHYSLSLLMAYFYVTETTTYRNRLFYFRKKHWSVLQARAIKDAVQSGHFKQLSKEETRKYLKGRCFGVSPLRFLPKVKDLRPIIALSAKVMLGGKNVGKRAIPPVNKQLTTLFHALSYLHKKDPRLSGASVMGREDIQVAWRRLAEYRLTNQDQRPLYMVKLDIEGCYNSMNQERLIAIVTKHLEQSEEYVTRQYCKLVMQQGQPRRHFCREVVPLVEYEPDVVQFVSLLQQQETAPLHDAVVLDQVRQRIDSAKDLIRQLKYHIYANLVSVDGKVYIQTRGISQGSVLSSILCSFYYGSMEAEHLVPCLEDELLIRQIDDFLYVTPHFNRALDFLNTMLKGIPSYNCNVKGEKTLTNFPVPGRPEILYLPANEVFPWCGLLLNPRTLNITVDYSRYTGLRISDTMSFDVSQNAGQHIKDKLTRNIRLQCHSVIVDSVVNSWTTSLINLFQLMILIAHRFVYCERSLPTHQRWHKNSAFFTGVVLRLSLVLVQCYNRRIRQMKAPLELTDNDIEYLSLHAFIHVLNKRRSVYKRLVSTLQRHQRQCQARMKWDRVEKMRNILNNQPEVLFLLK